MLRKLVRLRKNNAKKEKKRNCMENNVNNDEMIDKKEESRKKLSREVIVYLIFGVLTTIVGWTVYFVIMIGGRAVFSIPHDDTSSGAYFALYTAAQVIQWVCAVLFAFFTNRKWVFIDAKKYTKILPQLITFSGGRVVTFVLDYVMTLLGGMALANLLPMFNTVLLFDRAFNFNEIAAKLFAAVVVVVGNYIFSKLFVFRNKS